MKSVDALKRLESTLDYMAYEDCHSGGEEEVANKLQSLKFDFAWLFEYLQQECKE